MSKVKNYQSDIMTELLESISEEEQRRTDHRMLIAARIYDGIVAKGWKPSDLAREMNKRPSEISKWLSGTHNFTIDTLSDIGAVLGIGLITVKAEKKEVVNTFYLVVSANSGITCPDYGCTIDTQDDVMINKISLTNIPSN